MTTGLGTLAGVDAATFKSAMAALAAPVTIVTSYSRADNPIGLTVSAVMSLSLEPPLIAVSIGQHSSIHHELVIAPFFAINLLSPGSEPLAMQFAGPPPRRFDSVDVTDGLAPALAAASLTLTCERADTIDTGDHSLLVGRLVTVSGEADRAGGMVWHQRGFLSSSPPSTSAWPFNTCDQVHHEPRRPRAVKSRKQPC